MRELFNHTLVPKQLEFGTVLMDSWYAPRPLLLHIERAGKLFYCPLKANRQINEGADHPLNYWRVDALSWRAEEQLHGKSVHVKDFPKGHRLQLFRLVLSTERTDYGVTNDSAQHAPNDTQQVCAMRWKLEQLPREAKQITGLESCQCHKARSQRKHLACSVLVWLRLKELAHTTGRTGAIKSSTGSCLNI